MTEEAKHNIRAMVVSARLEMHIPFPSYLKDAMAEDTSQIAKAIAAMPEWARPVVGAYREYSPHILEFERGLDWPAIRAEFARKAKKIGLTASADVSFRCVQNGMDLWCVAVGRA